MCALTVLLTELLLNQSRFQALNLSCADGALFSPPSEVQVPAIDYVTYFIRSELKDDGFFVLYIKLKLTCTIQ
jgi:hypothetical protein